MLFTNVDYAAEGEFFSFFFFWGGGGGVLLGIFDGVVRPSCRPKYVVFRYPFSNLVPIVQRADNFIHWIVRYPADKMCARFS